MIKDMAMRTALARKAMWKPFRVARVEPRLALVMVVMVMMLMMTAVPKEAATWRRVAEKALPWLINCWGRAFKLQVFKGLMTRVIPMTRAVYRVDKYQNGESA